MVLFATHLQRMGAGRVYGLGVAILRVREKCTKYLILTVKYVYLYSTCKKFITKFFFSLKKFLTLSKAKNPDILFFQDSLK